MATTTTIGDFTVKGPCVAGAAPGTPNRYVVTPKGEPMINAMPGATHFGSVEEAVHAIHVFEAADRDGGKFWHLLAAVKGPETRASREGGEA